MTIGRKIACPVLICSLLVPAFTQTHENALVNPLTVETFEKFDVSGAATIDCLVLNSDAICNGQGPGLVVAGVNFNFVNNGQWNGAAYYGSPSRELLSDSQPLSIDFTTPVTVFGVDLRAYAGYPATATLTIYGLDGTTVIGTLSSIYLSGAGVPVRVGWQADAGIGKIGFTQTGHSWSPIIDNLEFAAPTARLTLSQSAASPGTPVAVTGTGFAANETIQLVWQHGGSSLNLGTLTADAGGVATGSTQVPRVPYATDLLYATGQTSGLFGAALLSVTPRLFMNPNSGTVGSSVLAQGLGFGAGEKVQVYWNNPRMLLGTATANSQGFFYQSTGLTFNIPAGAPPGQNVVSGAGVSTHAVGSGAVTVQ